MGCRYALLHFPCIRWLRGICPNCVQTYALIAGYKLPFAAVNDAVNNLVANTTGTPATVNGTFSPSQRTHGSGTKGSPFDQQFVLVTTGDQNAVAAVTAASLEAGLPPGIVNADAIPDPEAVGMDPFGIGLGHTVYVWLFRIAMCEDPAACQRYRQAQWPVYRITPKEAQAPGPVPYPLPTFKHRGTGTTENYLAKSLLDLEAAAAALYGHYSSQRVRAVLSPLEFDGIACIRQGTQCLGATRDALYNDGSEPLRGATQGVFPAPNTTFHLSDDPTDFVVLLGVIHTFTKPQPKASYTAIALYDIDKEMAVVGATDAALQGSATAFLPHDPNAGSLYVARFARNCNALQLPFKEVCLDVPSPPTFPGLPPTANASVVERAYMEPATTVGPAASEILPPILLQYRPR